MATRACDLISTHERVHAPPRRALTDGTCTCSCNRTVEDSTLSNRYALQSHSLTYFHDLLCLDNVDADLAAQLRDVARKSIIVVHMNNATMRT